MAQQTTHIHRRSLAPSLSEPKTSMDPTFKKHAKSNPISSSTTSTTKPHPTPPDPAVPSSTTIQNISNHFAKLYGNHKILASFKGSTGHSYSQPQSNTHLQAKGLSNPAILDTSCIALTKSYSQHGRKVAAADMQKLSTRTKVKEKDKKLLIKKSPHQELDVEKALARQKFNEVKKSVQKGCKKEGFYGGKDVKKASILMSKSLESDELKRLNEVCDMKRPSISLAMNGGRRRSFCCSQTELADFFSCTGVRVVAVDMPPFMQIHAVDCARKAYDSLEKFTSKTLALTLKREFDGVYGPAWHCIVGTSFGSFVTHSVGGFMYFSMDQKLYILLFKTTVQRAD